MNWLIWCQSLNNREIAKGRAVKPNRRLVCTLPIPVNAFTLDGCCSLWVKLKSQFDPHKHPPPTPTQKLLVLLC